MQSLHKTVDSFPLSTEPFHMDIHASIVLYTDEQNRVTKFLMINHSGFMGAMDMTAKKSDEKQEKTQEVSDLEVRKHMVGF
jgi:hypothetical protein